MVFVFLSFFLGWFLTLTFPSTDENEDTVLGSLPLLSFRVGGVEPSDNLTRRFAFKVSSILVGGLCGIAFHHKCILLFMFGPNLNK